MKKEYIYIFISILILGAGSIMLPKLLLPKEESSKVEEKPKTNYSPTPELTEDKDDQEVVEESEPTVTETVTPKVTVTSTPTSKPTSTPSPTPTNTDELLAGVDTNWVYGSRVQTSGDSVYFISSDDSEILKGKSTSDENASTVYALATGNKAQAFRIENGYLFLTYRKTGTDNLAFVRIYLKTKSTTTLYRFNSNYYDFKSFLINKNDHKRFYLGLQSVNGTRQPLVLYSKDYKEVWRKTVSKASVSDQFVGMFQVKDDTKLRIQFEPSKLVELDY